MTKLWDRLDKMNIKNIHVDWARTDSENEIKAKEINFSLDQIENGSATLVTDEELKDI